MNCNGPKYFPLKTRLDQASQEAIRLNLKPKRWDIWTFFDPSLAIIVHDLDTMIKYAAWYARNSDSPRWKKSFSNWLTSGEAWYSQDKWRWGLHWVTIANDVVDSKRCVFAFMTTQGFKGIPELLVQRNGDRSWVKPYNLWGGAAIRGSSLIENKGVLNEIPEVLGKIREFLLLENNIKWCSDHDHETFCKLCKFQYGELILVTNPVTGVEIPGVVIGDTAVSGREKLHGWDEPQVLFLMLTDHKEFHDDSKFYYPTNILYKKKGKKEEELQSVALTTFRVAPECSIRKWGNGDICRKIDDDIIDEIKIILKGEYFCLNIPK